MGLTFEKNNQLEKMLDKFAILPDDPKKKKAGATVTVEAPAGSYDVKIIAVN